MNSVLVVAYENEISLAKELIARNELEQGYTHLGRAHIIGQAFIDGGAPPDPRAQQKF